MSICWCGCGGEVLDADHLCGTCQMTLDSPNQDEMDGAAMRRMREALDARLDERWRCTVLLSEPDDEHRVVWVTASRLNEFKGLDIVPEDRDEAGKGYQTIAEAADKCREALA